MRFILVLLALCLSSGAAAQLGPYSGSFYQGMRDERLSQECRSGNQSSCEILRREQERQRQLELQDRSFEQQRERQQQQQQEDDARRFRYEQYENCLRLRRENPRANLQCTYPY